jgi:hypothetical protein
MGVAFLGSLIAIIILAILPKNVPSDILQILSQVLFVTLGYFGGAFATYMGFDLD